MAVLWKAHYSGGPFVLPIFFSPSGTKIASEKCVIVKVKIPEAWDTTFHEMISQIVNNLNLSR